MGDQTPNLGLYIPTPGSEVGWGEQVGANFEILDSAVADAISAVYRVNGITYIVANALWTGSAWNRVDTDRPAVRLMLNSTTGTMEIATAAAGANPITWTSGKLTNLATPTATADAATKGYVDGRLKISEIDIDAPKDWNGQDVSNVGELRATAIVEPTLKLVSRLPNGLTVTPVYCVVDTDCPDTLEEAQNAPIRRAYQGSSQGDYRSWTTVITYTVPAGISNQKIGIIWGVLVRYAVGSAVSSYWKLLKNGVEAESHQQNIGMDSQANGSATTYSTQIMNAGDIFEIQVYKTTPLDYAVIGGFMTLVGSVSLRMGIVPL